MKTFEEYMTLEEIREFYEIEKELAAQLRLAPKHERKGLYTSLYDELFRRVPKHPQLQARASGGKARLVHLDLVRRFLDRESTFLEIGPGDCNLAFEVARQVRKVYGVDVSEEITKVSEHPDNFHLEISDGSSIPVPENSATLAFSNQLMEHLHPEDALDQLRGIYRALVPGGLYICITPSRLSGPHDVSRHFDDVATGFHLKEYTTIELIKLFRQVGFRRFRKFIYKPGFFVSFPALPTLWLERGLETLPHSLCRGISLWAPVRMFAGGDIKLMAWR